MISEFLGISCGWWIAIIVSVLAIIDVTCLIISHVRFVNYLNEVYSNDNSKPFIIASKNSHKKIRKCDDGPHDADPFGCLYNSNDDPEDNWDLL